MTLIEAIAVVETHDSYCKACNTDFNEALSIVLSAAKTKSAHDEEVKYWSNRPWITDTLR